MRAVLASSLLLACRVVAGAGWAKPSSISPRLPHALHAFVKPEQGTNGPTLAVKPQEGTPGDIRKRRPPKACCARPRWERGKRHGHASAMVCGATIVREQCHSTVGTAPNKGPDRTGQSLGTGGWGAGAPPGPTNPRGTHRGGRPEDPTTWWCCTAHIQHAKKSFEAGCYARYRKISS